MHLFKVVIGDHNRNLPDRFERAMNVKKIIVHDHYYLRDDEGDTGKNIINCLRIKICNDFVIRKRHSTAGAC